MIEFPRFKYTLTDPDKYILNNQLKSLSMELLELTPMEGISSFGINSEEIIKLVLRTAVDTTSVNGVTTSTEDTPNREPAMN